MMEQVMRQVEAAAVSRLLQSGVFVAQPLQLDTPVQKDFQLEGRKRPNEKIPDLEMKRGPVLFQGLRTGNADDEGPAAPVPLRFQTAQRPPAKAVEVD